MANARKLFSKNLKRLRVKKDLTQEELAEKLGITARYVQKLEGVRCPNVKIDTIADIAKTINVRMSDFFQE